jgi:hypothetical protein
MSGRFLWVAWFFSGKRGGPFIGGRGSTGGVQWRPAHRACRPWEGQGVVLAWAAGYCVLWELSGALAGGGVVWFRGEPVRGPGGFPLFLRVSRSWVGAGEAGDRQRSVHGMATGPGTNENSVGTVEPIFPGFRSPRVRSNARKKSKFEFSKNSTWVGHYIG